MYHDQYLASLTPTKPELIDYFEALFIDQGWQGPPIVVLQDSREGTRWILSDPHRYAAAVRAHVHYQTIRIQDLFEQHGRDYWEAVDGMREHFDKVREQTGRQLMDTEFWWDMVLDASLPSEAIAYYWSEEGDGCLPYGVQRHLKRKFRRDQLNG